MARREFTTAVYKQIVKRASTADGDIACENCGLLLGKKKWHVDHTDPDALQIDKTRKLTADDGKLLGVECCHKPKTKIDAGILAQANAREANDMGIPKKMKGRPFSKAPAAPKPATKTPLPPRQLYGAPS